MGHRNQTWAVGFITPRGRYTSAEVCLDSRMQGNNKIQKIENITSLTSKQASNGLNLHFHFNILRTVTIVLVIQSIMLFEIEYPLS
jgi:hypothetical protein